MDEVRTEALGLVGCFEVRQPVEQLAEHHRDLPPGEMGAKAEVGARAAETHMEVRAAA